jgi:hypothetical protein
MPGILRVDHVALWVRDLEAMGAPGEGGTK